MSGKNLPVFRHLHVRPHLQKIETDGRKLKLKGGGGGGRPGHGGGKWPLPRLTQVPLEASKDVSASRQIKNNKNVEIYRLNGRLATIKLSL